MTLKKNPNIPNLKQFPEASLRLFCLVLPRQHVFLFFFYVLFELAPLLLTSCIQVSRNVSKSWLFYEATCKVDGAQEFHSQVNAH